MSQINNGLAQLKIGTIAVDGGMGTVLTALGYITEDSFKINTEDGTATDFMVEEIDDPIFSRTTAGKISFEFEIANPDAPVLVTVFGGTSDANGGYTPPNSAPVIEKSLEIIPSQGFGFKVPRAKITAKFSDTIGKNQLLKVVVTAQVLAPTKVGEAKFKIPKYVDGVEVTE